MGRSRIIRLLVLAAGLGPLCAGFGALGAAVAWHHFDPYLALFPAILGLGFGVGGVWWWLGWARDEVVDEAAPRTVQYVYLQPKPPPRTFSTVYYPVTHPADDALAMDLMRDLMSNTGDLTAYRG